MFFILLWLFYFLPCLPQMALTWRTCWHQGGRRKLAWCLKQPVSGLESWIWILLFCGAPTPCQPCDVGYFSLVVKTHLQCRWLSWTRRAASILSHEYLQQESPVLPGTSISQHPYNFFWPQTLQCRQAVPRGREIAFCSWIFNQSWPKSDFIWSSAVSTGLFDLSIYVKINSTHPRPTPPQYILSYLCIRHFFHIFSAEHIRFFCVCHNRLKLVSDARKHIPPSSPCTSRSYTSPPKQRIQHALCLSLWFPQVLPWPHQQNLYSSSKVSSTAGQRVSILPQKGFGALLHWAELPLQKHHSLKPTTGVRGANRQNCHSWLL